jgi:isopentenyl-diphosphate delta-isomerase
MTENIILVDEKDNVIGTEEKIKIHQEGKLHRAFSIFIFNSNGELLLQRRAKSKYHSGGLWTNTCCSHQREGESLEEAIHRRLKEEMGFDCELKEAFTFTYKVKFDNGLSENEYDHVFMGRYEGEPNPNPEEVDEWKWIKLEELKQDTQENPDNYTYWLKASIDKVISYLKSQGRLNQITD